MRTVLAIIFVTFATQASADIVMVCNAKNYEKRFYKLVEPFFGEKTVEQKIDGRWVNWCKDKCVKFEVYETGAMQTTQFFHSWDESSPEQGIVAKRNYLIELQYWLDFEFGRRRVKEAVYTDISKRKQLTDKNLNTDDTYSCEIEGSKGYLRKFKGTIEGVFE